MQRRSKQRILPFLWLTLAIANAMYSQLYYANTAIDLDMITAGGGYQIVRISPWASLLSLFAILMMLVYSRTTRLQSTALGWLHFWGTTAAIWLLWNVLSLALSFGLPGRFHTSEEMAREIVQQRANLIVWEFKAAAFLFILSQILLVINLSRKKTDEVDEDRLSSELLDEL